VSGFDTEGIEGSAMFASGRPSFLRGDDAAPEVDRETEPVEPRDWVVALTTPSRERDQALRDLHGLMIRAARHQVWRMQPMLRGAGHDTCEELANQAADDALAILLAKVHTFQGRSRFTTWAYKFAILQAATEVRRHAWRNREVSLDDVELRPDAHAGPEQHAEAADLARAVSRAMIHSLTGHQRRIAVALLVDQVPIDVLADRLGTTRGALYKTLHEVRTRLRRCLADTGHLPGSTEGNPP
jgi:RNA polymerase sigma-70 factor, ECF subfamily